MASPAEQRRSAILRAARICFLDRGFVSTTISDVVALAGGSRSTVYEEFGSKEGLFAAIVSECLDLMKLGQVAEGPPETVLRATGLAYMDQLMDAESLALYRVAVGESAHVRGLGEAIFKAGPQAAAGTLAGWLRKWADEGLVELADPERCARQFLAMVEGDLHRAAVMWNRTPSEEEVTANVDAAVTLFLAGARKTARVQPSQAAGGEPAASAPVIGAA